MTSVNYLPNHNADNLHLSYAETITSCEITSRTSWQNISLNMCLAIIYSIKPSRGNCGSTVSARLFNYLKNFTNRKITIINSLVCLAKKYSPAFIRSTVPKLSKPVFRSLIHRHKRITVFSIFPPKFSRAVTSLALVGNSKQSTGIFYKMFGSRFIRYMASMTGSFHVGMLAQKDGPHFQLTWALYP